MGEAGSSIIALPVFNSAGERTGVEKLPVEQIAGGYYKLTSSPGFVEGLAADDVIQLVSDDECGYRIITRGRNLCVWFFFPERDQNQGPEGEHLHGEVERVGGWLDGGGVYLLIFTIPVAVGFPTVEHLFNVAVERVPGTEWLYGNVYDPSDGVTPLGWWDES